MSAPTMAAASRPPTHRPTLRRDQAAARLPVSVLTPARFSDSRHLDFYGASSCGASGQLRDARRRPVVQASAAASSRRSRVLQHVADVEETLRQLEQAEPLAAFDRLQQHHTAPARARRRTGSSDSSSSESSDSSDSEPEVSSSSSVAAMLARRLQQQQQLAMQQLQQQAAGNIVPLTPPTAAPAVAAPVAVKVCQGKACTRAGAATVLQQYAAMPGVVAQSVPKCMGQCKRCVAVKMAAPGSPDTLYTGVNTANAADVLAMHQQQTLQQRRVPVSVAAATQQ